MLSKYVYYWTDRQAGTAKYQIEAHTCPKDYIIYMQLQVSERRTTNRKNIKAAALLSQKDGNALWIE